MEYAEVSNANLKQYLKNIKTMLPLKGKEEKKFITDLNNSIQDYIESNPDYTILDIYDRFGTPAEIVSGYFDTVDINRLISRLKVSKWIKRAILILILLAFSYNCFKGVLLFREFQSAQQSNAYVIETTLEEE